MPVAGKIVRYNAERCFGWIKPDVSGPDLFLHVTSLAEGENPADLVKDTRVTFETANEGRGPKAVNVHIMKAVVATELDNEECDVLAPEEFSAEVDKIMERHLAAARADLLSFARSHNWVD